MKNGRRDTSMIRAARTAALAALAVGAFCSPVSGESVAEKAVRPELSIKRSAQYDYDIPAPGTYRLPVIRPAGDGQVLTASAKVEKLHSILFGRITIVSFVYTRCADPRACPMATGVLHEIHGITKRDAGLAEKLQLVTFSFDPEHDTPRVMEQYAASLRPGGSGSEWQFLTTRNVEELEPILASYGQRVDRKKDSLDPLGPFYHMIRVYLVDGEGMIRNIYAYGMLDPRLLITDVRTLVMETSPQASE